MWIMWVIVCKSKQRVFVILWFIRVCYYFSHSKCTCDTSRRLSDKRGTPDFPCLARPNVVREGVKKIDFTGSMSLILCPTQPLLYPIRRHKKKKGNFLCLHLNRSLRLGLMLQKIQKNGFNQKKLRPRVVDLSPNVMRGSKILREAWLITKRRVASGAKVCSQGFSEIIGSWLDESSKA